MTASTGVIFTFYSFKGGVGRSMALANIGVHFHRQGYRTLLIDMDLEAPGLERYFEDNPQFRAEGVAGRGGFIDFIQAYLKRASATVDDPNERLYPALDDYLTELTSEGGGRLTLMHAGRRWEEHWPDYVRFIQNFDWTDFYERWEGGACLEWFATELRERFEIVLIDSRTGVTEMGGVATQHLADAVVVLFGSNLQNVENSANMIRSFLGGGVQEARGGRALPVLAVPARVDDQDSRGFAEFQKRITEAFASISVVPTDGYGMDEMRVPYLASFSFREQILFGNDEIETSARRILDSYGRIAANMQRLAPQGTALQAGVPNSRARKFQVALLASSQDEPLAKPLSALLTQEGFDCITLGNRTLSDEDSSRLSSISCSIAVVTPTFGESTVLRSLLQILTDLAKPIIPAVFSPVTTMPLLLADKSSVDCTAGVSAAAPVLVAAIKAIREAGRSETRKPTGVYLSYHEENLPLASQLYKFLVARGLSVFFASEHIAPGERVQAAVERALTDADIMVALLSPSSTDSQALRAEWTFFASTLKKPVVPVLATETKVPFLFARTQPIDLTRMPPVEEIGKGATPFEQLVEAIRTRLDEKPDKHSDDTIASQRISHEQEARIHDDWLKFSPRPNALTGDQKWHVYVSYRSSDRLWALNLCDILRQQGFKVFVDQLAIKAGDELLRILGDALDQSQAAVLIWSSANMNSEWVRHEYQALERAEFTKKIFSFVPVTLDQSRLPVFASNRVFLDFSSYPDGPNGGELLRLLHAIVGRPLTPEAAHFAAEQDAVAQQAATEIGAAIRNRDPELLLELSQSGALAWRTSATLGCKAAEGLIKLGKFDEAILMLQHLEQEFPRATRPRQLRALASVRRGDLRQAQRILGALYEAGQRDAETLGLYARTWMDRYSQSRDLADLRQSRDFYAEAFEQAPDDYYTGINAASKSVMLGTPEDIARGQAYAERVQKLVGTSPKSGDYWGTVTVAECLLLQRKYSEAADLYGAAIAMAPMDAGSHESTWRQANLLMDALLPTRAEWQLVRQAF